MQWVIRTSDNVFLRDKGGEALATGEAEHAVTRVPDPRTERADATTPTGIRSATAQEITDYDAAQKDTLIRGEAGRVLIRAMLLFYLRRTLGREPTAAERLAARSDFIQAYKDVT